mmetsp:Transcript_13849/g.15507  ORF Transcript_13849/g.15507 Transcript_13849/m.15507 type:complete len:448 (-) Transcript_13849:20-1363(-)|eukprot:CAMPEP_0205830354 /NCGR_PEP_ID=MMETSP0206-20130828/40803_1 /ASSEMBLY_ACC=CAM_ASM_000279 /TAXON_ID=36767 /ORGANISM="Euplotes focardii, Strain TN1" /LENGTH=447 /DNA_ID=CAMNT_0053133943 /DNA_START=321 /DNA_END=1664 /DNA_ORIENTATION=+
MAPPASFPAPVATGFPTYAPIATGLPAPAPFGVPTSAPFGVPTPAPVGVPASMGVSNSAHFGTPGTLPTPTPASATPIYPGYSPQTTTEIPQHTSAPQIPTPSPAPSTPQPIGVPQPTGFGHPTGVQQQTGFPQPSPGVPTQYPGIPSPSPATAAQNTHPMGGIPHQTSTIPTHTHASAQPQIPTSSPAMASGINYNPITAGKPLFPGAPSSQPKATHIPTPAPAPAFTNAPTHIPAPVPAPTPAPAPAQPTGSPPFHPPPSAHPTGTSFAPPTYGSPSGFPVPTPAPAPVIPTITQSNPGGQTHADTESFNDYEANKAIFDSNQTRVAELRVIHNGNQVFGFEAVYESIANGGQISGGMHVGKDLDATCMNQAFPFQQDEDITAINGKHGNVVDSLTIITSKGRTFTFGGPGGDYAYSLVIPAGKKVKAFAGGLGGHLHNISVFYE